MFVGVSRFHTIIIDYNGGIWASGGNSYGELALGDTTPRTLGEGIQGTFIGVAVSDYNTLLLDMDGNVWMVGKDCYGVDKGVDRNKLSKIEDLPSIVNMATTSTHTLVLDIEGNVWSAGHNIDLCLGLPSFIVCEESIHSLEHSRLYEDKPRTNYYFQINQIPSLPKITDIQVNKGYSLFLDECGYVWACGSNSSNVFGNKLPLKVYPPTKIPNIKNIKQISAGETHALYLDYDGGVWASGKHYGIMFNEIDFHYFHNYFPYLPEIVNICAGKYCSFLIDEKGTVWIKGRNVRYQLGIGQSHNQPNFVAIPALPPINHVECQSRHTIFIGEDGSVWGCGDNYTYQLFRDDINSTLGSPIRLPVAPPIFTSSCLSSIKSARK